MAAPNNPAGSSTPAGNTMSVPRSVSGGRTRNVINLAAPGAEGTTAYSFTAATDAADAPTAATQGYANFHSQRYLHVVITNAGGGNAILQLYGYHSFAGQWGRLNIGTMQNEINAASQQYKITVGDSEEIYVVFPIQGIERIYVNCPTHPGSSAAVNVYLGVNSF